MNLISTVLFIYSRNSSLVYRRCGHFDAFVVQDQNPTWNALKAEGTFALCCWCRRSAPHYYCAYHKTGR